jgi:hypothetical protein
MLEQPEGNLHIRFSSLMQPHQPETALQTSSPRMTTTATKTAAVNTGPLPPAFRAVSISLTMQLHNKTRCYGDAAREISMERLAECSWRNSADYILFQKTRNDLALSAGSRRGRARQLSALKATESLATWLFNLGFANDAVPRGTINCLDDPTC